MYTLLVLERISLRAGATSDAPGLAFQPGSVTLFVGPDNSGKSLVLREIERFVREGGQASQGAYKVVDSVDARLRRGRAGGPGPSQATRRVARR